MKAILQVSVYNKIRRIQVSPLNGTEDNDMIDWHTLTATKLLVTIYLTNKELKDMISAKISQSFLSLLP